MTALVGDNGAPCGVSISGVVRHADGLVHEAPNLRWTDVAVGGRLAAALVANDAELGVLAENLRGAAQGMADVVFVSAGIGVGGGVIAQGTSLRGTAGYVGEIGHMVVHPHGAWLLLRQPGCWETEVGEAAFCRALGLPEASPRGALVVALWELAARPDAAREVLGELAEWLTLGLVNVVNLLGPELVVLGDLFTALPDTVLDDVAAEVDRRSLVSRALGGVRVWRSSLGPDVKLLGAAEVAFEAVLDTV